MKRTEQNALTEELDLDDLLGALELEELLPDELAAWRPLLAAATSFFLGHLPPARLAAIVDAQLGLPADADPHRRLMEVLLHSPTLHKLGQVLARERRLPVELRRHLQTLESLMPTLPMEQVRAGIRAELGEIPVTLAPEILAEGSVAVVVAFSYRDEGTLHEGVFKLLKPGIERRLSEDLVIWNKLAEFLEQQRGQALGLPIPDCRATLESVGELLIHEVRLDVEQHNLRKAAAFYAEDSLIRIPRLLPWCTPRLTAMERMRGCKLTDAALAVPERRAAAHALVAALLGRPFWSRAEAPPIHADLHGGNLLATEDGRLAVIDWSLTVSLSKEQREALLALALGACTLDASGMRTASAKLSGLRGDDRPVSAVVERALDRVALLDELPGFTWLMKLLDDLAMHGGKFPHNLVLLRKTWLSLAGVVADLVPDYSPDAALLGVGVKCFVDELPARLLAGFGPGDFATHVSNAELVGLLSASWLVPLRYWLRRDGRGAAAKDLRHAALGT